MTNSAELWRNKGQRYNLEGNHDPKTGTYTFPPREVLPGPMPSIAEIEATEAARKERFATQNFPSIETTVPIPLRVPFPLLNGSTFGNLRELAILQQPER